MPSYEDCVIYTIRTGEHLYVGSTCNFTQRKYQHRNCIHNENSSHYPAKLYKTIRENDGGWDMQPHKLFPCKNKMEMRIEEERFRVELNADLNMLSCYGLKKNYHFEYRQKNKELIIERNKKYMANNKELIIEKGKEKVTCECGCEICKRQLKRHQKTKKHLEMMEAKQKNIKDV
jgi:hypothetical protein